MEQVVWYNQIVCHFPLIQQTGDLADIDHPKWKPQCKRDRDAIDTSTHVGYSITGLSVKSNDSSLRLLSPKILYANQPLGMIPPFWISSKQDRPIVSSAD